MTGRAAGQLADAEARRRAVEELDTTFLVEAAAGSGKTTLLLGRIVSLVRSGRARLPEIAAITFTEKAAAELRIRLRAELERAGAAQALRDLELARIGTIHAFAADLLRERPVEAGVDPGFTVADPLSAQLLLDRVWEAWLPEALANPDAAEPVREAIERGVGLDRLRALAFALVEARDSLAGLPGPAALPEDPAALDAAARAVLARLAERARAAARDPDDRAVRAIEDLAAWAQQTATLPDPDRLRALLEGAPFPERPERLGNQARWRDRAALAECRAALAALRERVLGARAVARHNLLAGLARWAAGFVDAYQAAKARAGCLDFLDLLVHARDLVRDRPDVRRDVQRAIRYLLVDEFQDTDPLQLEMVRWLAEGAPSGSLFVVGDPKQSIYRFRRADIETYAEARAALGRIGEVLTVQANFRSGRALLDAVNGVFEDVMVPPPDGDYQPAYVPLEPAPATPPGTPPVILVPSETTPAPASAPEAWAQEGRLVAAYLAREVEARGRFGYGDVAILFRAMTGVAAYEDALREAGIPFRTIGGRHYYDRSEVGWAIAALGAIEDPHDPVALVGALRSPFFGVSDAALAAFHAAGGTFCYLRPLPPGADPAIAEAWALLAELHRERNRHAPAAIVERLLTRTQVLAAYALEPQGEARVANLLKVLDTARALEATGALTFRGFVRWLRDRGAARYEEEESAVEAEGCVRLLTIHKAKGLQFPVVVVPDLGREPPWRPPVVLVDRRSGCVELCLGRVGDGPLATLGWTETEAREVRRLEAEGVRLLYVAMTRAERLLVLPVPPRPEGRGFSQYLAALLAGPAESLSADELLQVVRPAATEPGPRAAPETLAGWRAARAALVARGGAIEDGEPEARLAADRSEPRGPADARAAAALDLARAALRVLDLARPDDEALAVVAALGARRDATPELVRAAGDRLKACLASPAVRRARAAGRVHRDVPVAAIVDGTLVEDRLDLLFEEAGELVAVRVGAGSPDGARRAGLDAAALTRLLGGPVREVVDLHLP